MNRCSSLTIVLILAIVGCQGPSSNSGPSTAPEEKPTEEVTSTKITSYEKVPFKKLISPAFSKNYYGKGVEFECSYHGQLNMVMDLPERFKKDHVRINVYNNIKKGGGMMDPSTWDTPFANLLIPAAKSDIAFTSEVGDRWNVKAQCIKSTTVSGVTGAGQQSIILIADEVKKIQ